MTKLLDILTKEAETQSQMLGLKQAPTFKIIQTGNIYMGTEYEYKELCNVITDITPLYIVNVNERKLTLLLEHFVSLTNNDVIKHDVIKAVLRHEIRHIFQQEHKHLVGATVGNCKKTELDADKWMIKSATTAREKILAQYLKTVIHEKHENKLLKMALQKAY